MWGLHPNGRLWCPEYEFMLCVANIKMPPIDCLEPRATSPAQADQCLRPLRLKQWKLEDSENSTRQAEVQVREMNWRGNKAEPG